MVKIEIIENLEDFLKLSDAWDELVSGSEVDHAFMRHLWYAEVIKAYFANDTLAVVIIRRDGQLVAAAPMRRTVYRIRGLGVKTLSFISTEITPRCNFIVADSDLLEPLVMSVIGAPDWDVLYAKNLEENAATTKKFIELIGNSLDNHGSQVIEGLLSPYLHTSGSWEEYWQSFSKKRRRTLTAYSIKRLEEAGSGEISRIESQEELREFLPRMFEISAASWKADTNDHLRPDSPEGRFYLGFTPAALASDQVLIYTIKIDGKYVGFDYYLRCGNSYTGSRSDYNERYKYYSPGNNLKLAAIRHLFEQEQECVYDLGGDAHQYKLDWGCEIRRHLTFTIGNHTLKGRLIMAGKNKVLPLARSIGRRLSIRGLDD
ncbi:MAG: GNAT family N-acetyltransferase [candidate division Zixibacteria bacterium]|nr:GNAT family N-acetyltransferase [candidate division Zixibacteria bacterium]MBU2626825.1 GNAT family N-acetyltransferase [candidate division Zixibacteria bacterium]